MSYIFHTTFIILEEDYWNLLKKKKKFFIFFGFHNCLRLKKKKKLCRFHWLFFFFAILKFPHNSKIACIKKTFYINCTTTRALFVTALLTFAPSGICSVMIRSICSYCFFFGNIFWNTRSVYNGSSKFTTATIINFYNKLVLFLFVSCCCCCFSLSFASFIFFPKHSEKTQLPYFFFFFLPLRCSKIQPYTGYTGLVKKVNFYWYIFVKPCDHVSDVIEKVLKKKKASNSAIDDIIPQLFFFFLFYYVVRFINEALKIKTMINYVDSGKQKIAEVNMFRTAY